MSEQSKAPPTESMKEKKKEGQVKRKKQGVRRGCAEEKLKEGGEKGERERERTNFLHWPLCC